MISFESELALGNGCKDWEIAGPMQTLAHDRASNRDGNVSIVGILLDNLSGLNNFMTGVGQCCDICGFMVRCAKNVTLLGDYC